MGTFKLGKPLHHYPFYKKNLAYIPRDQVHFFSLMDSFNKRVASKSEPRLVKMIIFTCLDSLQTLQEVEHFLYSYLKYFRNFGLKEL